MEKHEVSKLIGAPPGYVGYEEGGKLTERVRRRPYSVVLFDEIEKAHPDIFNILLQILEDGRLTDGQGRTVDFRNTVILMTSNVGAREAARGSTLGFSGGDEKDPFDWSKLKAAIMDEVNRIFRPEFLNRLDEMIVFRPLNRESMMSIVAIMVDEVVSRLSSRGIVLSVGDEVMSFLLDRGYQPKYGARPLRRTIQPSLRQAGRLPARKGKHPGSEHSSISRRRGSEIPLHRGKKARFLQKRYQSRISTFPSGEGGSQWTDHLLAVLSSHFHRLPQLKQQRSSGAGDGDPEREKGGEQDHYPDPPPGDHGFWGMFSRNFINIEDSEEILRAIRLTSDDTPIDIIIHTPGDSSWLLNRSQEH